MLREVHPANIFFHERISKLLAWIFAAWYYLAPDLKVLLPKMVARSPRVNAAPGFPNAYQVSRGLHRAIARPVINITLPKKRRYTGRHSYYCHYRYRGQNNYQPPGFAYHEICRYKVGFTTSDSIYIQNHLMSSGDCTGPVQNLF